MPVALPERHAGLVGVGIKSDSAFAIGGGFLDIPACEADPGSQIVDIASPVGFVDEVASQFFRTEIVLVRQELFDLIRRFAMPGALCSPRDGAASFVCGSSNHPRLISQHASERRVVVFIAQVAESPGRGPSTLNVCGVEQSEKGCR